MLHPVLISYIKDRKMQILNVKSLCAKNCKRGHTVNQAGFSLVELMVGLVIGLLATLAIMQVFGAFEGQKRTTSGNADAQTNGSVALYNLQREVKLAGYGLPLFDEEDMPLTCNTTSLATTATGTAPSIPINIVPIAIQDGGAAAGASDTITVHFGSSNSAGVSSKVNAIAGTAGTPIDIGNNMNCNNNDIVIAIDGNNCVAQQVTPPPPFPNAINLTVIPRVNNTQITLHSNGLPPNDIKAGSKLSCIGTWNTVTYAINANNQLTRNGTAIVDGIVNIQAQYGISANYQSNQITQWVNATGAWATSAVTPTTATEIELKQ